MRCFRTPPSPTCWLAWGEFLSAYWREVLPHLDGEDDATLVATFLSAYWREVLPHKLEQIFGRMG